MPARWIMVANTVNAQIYQIDGKQLCLMAEFDHPEGLKKAQELTTDRPGQYNTSHNGQGSSPPAHSPKEVEDERFAMHLCQVLEQARNAQQFQVLTLIAPAHFVGLLTKHCSKPLKNLIDRVIQKNIINLPSQTLKAFIIASHPPFH